MTAMEKQELDWRVLVLIAMALIIGGIFIGAKGLAEENPTLAVLGIGLGFGGMEILEDLKR